jgi:hypothetical protein
MSQHGKQLLHPQKQPNRSTAAAAGVGTSFFSFGDFIDQSSNSFS